MSISSEKLTNDGILNILTSVQTFLNPLNNNILDKVTEINTKKLGRQEKATSNLNRKTRRVYLPKIKIFKLLNDQKDEVAIIFRFSFI